MKRTWTLVASLLVALLFGAPELLFAQAKRPPATKAAAKAEQPKFKAIWEPVNYPEDVLLTSVDFVSAEEGWVAGGKTSQSGGIILHTKDGGKTWDVQLGDPQSSDRAIGDLHFIDATHGWAVQKTGVGDHKLLHTSDGQAWLPTGTVAQHRRDYWFTSETTGYVAGKGGISVTRDGGKKWETAYNCTIKAEIKGLTRQVTCEPERLFFVSPQIGYAISQGLPENGGSVLIKTEDGGAHWKEWIVLAGENAREGALYFLDEKSGFLRAGSKLFRTDDGGQTWTGIAATAEGKPEIKFSGGTGWMIAHTKLTYSTDSGKRWTSREFSFPARVQAFSLPSPDSGYAVGEHGMIYRYRIVPIDYTAKGMLDAPAMASQPAAK